MGFQMIIKFSKSGEGNSIYRHLKLNLYIYMLVLLANFESHLVEFEMITFSKLTNCLVLVK